MRVLIVDDEMRLSRHVSSALTEAGHDPVPVHDGESALRVANESAFDLIVLDVGLPGIDGFEVLRRLRAHHNMTRVIMLTARGG
jgi:DNA-binding response OmpR family regulator